MEENKLSINQDVLEQMAVLATLEIEGVAAMAEKAVDLKGAVAHGKLFKSAHVTEKNGAVVIDLYIKIRHSVNAKTVAEAVQDNVKEKLQSMTGNAITRVNVTVADVDGADEETAQ